MRKDMEFNIEIDPAVDEVFDESVGNSFLAMRRLRWNEDGVFKLDLRKWITDSTGKEIAGKGFSFITEEGPANLVNCLLKHGYADTRKTLEGLQDREDFVPECMRILSEKGALPEGSFATVQDEPGSGGFYDPNDFFDNIGDE
jgi:hypothetical protein